jgi:ArsR family transcriptional regulator, nickel/cobalt-responsive transcriptional repressor
MRSQRASSSRNSGSRNSGDCANRLAVLADPTRLAVIEVLLDGPCNVKEINRQVQVAQNLLSHHLRVLREAGLVISQRDGKGVKYALARGVELGRSHNGINLGCCSLTFTNLHAGKRVP